MDPTDATPVSVRGGDDFPGVDFSLQPVHTVTVGGRVFNAVTGQPGVSTNLFLIPQKSFQGGFFPSQIQTYVQDPLGQFKLDGVVPGSYFLVAMAHAEGKTYVSRLPLEVGDANLGGLTLTISPGINLRGRVQGLSKSETPAVQVNLEPQDQHIYFSSNSANPKENGTFEISNVSDGSYSITVRQLPEDAYIKDIRAGEQSVLTSGLEISGGQNPGNLEIVVSPNGARVEGTVMKGNQLFSGATVVLVPGDVALRKDQRFYKTTTTDQNGSYSVRGVRPGEYKVYAWEKIEPGAYQDPSFLQQYEDEGKTIEVKEGGQISVPLTLLTESQRQ